MAIAMMRATHEQRLERWLGADKVEHLSRSMKDWYGPPIAVGGVPGNVWAHRGGGFSGPIKAGQVAPAIDFVEQRLKRIARNWTQRQMASLHMAGFSSLSDLIAEASGGKRRDYPFQKNGPTGVVNVSSSLWRLGSMPAAGGAGSAAPGGRACSDATTGSFTQFWNPGGTDTTHFVGAGVTASVINNTLLLYDRLFDVAKTMNSSATESVTGVPTRYQSSTVTDPDYAGGNFIFVEVGGTALAATGHNWTVCRYRNQAGTDTQTMPSLTGNSGAIVDRLDHPVGQWFAPLASGDTGAMDLDQMQCSAAVATGAVNFVIGHPIAMLPCPVANLICQMDGIGSAFNLVRIFDDACLAFLEVCKPATTATNYAGILSTVAG